MHKLIFIVLLATGCSTQEINKPYPKVQPKCTKDYIQFCEGRHPQNMECVCVERSTMDRELRNLIY